MEKLEIPSFKVQFGDYSREDGVTVFNIRVLSSKENSFHILDRYKNMRLLWEDIRRTAKDPDRIPEFPPKKWFGSKSKEFIEQRRCALEIFFNTLLDAPDGNIYKHTMAYFKKLANNREAKDAIEKIEDSVSASGKPKQKVDSKPLQSALPDKPKEENKVGAAVNPAKKNLGKKEDKGGLNAKDYAENCYKIVENFNKNIIDLGFGGNGGDIPDIISKNQTYVKHFNDSGVNKNFEYQTKLLTIPKGDDDNIKLLDNEEEEIEQLNDVSNEKLEKLAKLISHQLYVQPFEKYIGKGKIIYHSS